MIETLPVNSLQRLLFMYETWKEKGDVQHSLKLLDVIQKYGKQEFMIAFCGHFSAGKSTMMNYLYGQELLPTSPIPTSANVVQIQKGSDRVVITLQSGEKHSYEGMYTDTQLKQLCKNGDEVTGVHIYRHDAPLPAGVMLVDTPGIDSTDDAHKLATESALHLADVIFYMMDYNHVQSEVNLQFVKELKQRNKRVYLVVNQIDKHKDDELSFASYRKSVSEAFANWNIETDGIYYTSLRKQDQADNELPELRKLLESLVVQRTMYMQESMQNETEYLLKEHMRFVVKQAEEEIEPLRRSLSEGSLSCEDIAANLQRLYEEKEQAERKEVTIRNTFTKEIDHILHNAYLMPYEVRDLAERYLETELSTFKVGFFFSKSKTKKEKEDRLHAFYEKLKGIVETQLDFHVKEQMLSFLKRENLYSEALAQQVYGLQVAFEPAMLTSAVKQGAGLTGDYVLNYTNDVAHVLKKTYRDAANIFFERQLPLIKEHMQYELAKLHKDIQQYEQQQAAWEETAVVDEDIKQYEQLLSNVWKGNAEAQATIQLKDVMNMRQEITIAKPIVFEAAQPHAEVEQALPAVNTELTAEERIQTILASVKQVEETIRPISLLRHVYDEIVEKRKRVETKQFTVALFGAFSAGKSSFANALLGEKVLPVSPNPTTATINKILPITAEHPHGTVLVQLKSEQTLLQDLQEIYKLFGKRITTLEEGMMQIDELLRHPSPSGRQKTTFSFLRALQRGYSAFQDQLGQMIRTAFDDFSEYVANEEKSCFVEYIELYYDCEFTRKGITLVDTPGADSVNARHTDVAFQYIKNADAILFVTYYNHVFSKADREFLIQLGRVKDSFAMDKMFFLINAADLAESEEELQTVKQYIADQLLQYGIRHPRLFALSSLFALDEKKGCSAEKGQYGILQQSGMSAFEEAFTSFTMRDLMIVSLTALNASIKGANSLLANIIANALEGNEQKEAKKKRYGEERLHIVKEIAAYSVLTEEKALEKEVHELLFYVKQRVFFRYQNVFAEIFNPAVLRTDGGDIKQRLRECTSELSDFLMHDLLQEMRATSLRLEKWMNEKLHFSCQELQKTCLSYNKELSFVPIEDASYTSAAHIEPFAELDLQQFKKSWSIFKNAKSFFEHNEKARMQEEMKKVLEPLVSSYIEEEQQLLARHYGSEWQRAWGDVKQNMEEQATQYYEGVLAALSEKIDVSVYKSVKHAVQCSIEDVEQELSVL